MLKRLEKPRKIKKIKKPKAKPLSYYRNKCDKMIQELGRLTYNECLSCGNKSTVLHHYYPKSSAGSLRYHWANLIPLCNGCHFRHHNGDPRIQNAINKSKGLGWLDMLNEEKKKYVKCNTKEYFKSIYENLCLALKNYQPKE